MGMVGMVGMVGMIGMVGVDGVVGMDGVVGVVTPVNGELDVNRLGTSRLEVVSVGVGGVGEVGLV